MTDELFSLQMQEKKERVEAIIHNYLLEEDAFPGSLASAVNYSMNAGGKRVRPILMSESYQIFGGKGAVIEPMIAAIEMIHTHSLIHDDLPAIDNDDYRRGRKTAHVVYGEALGVLAGDALLNLAYETALQAFAYEDLMCPPDRTVAALRILAEKTGIRGMLGGQGVDVENEKNHIVSLDQKTLDYIYENKTSALIEAPLMIGAVMAGADKGSVKLMEQVGHLTGLAFQIRDDILDVTGTLESIGKPAGSDTKNDKTTYVTLFGVEKAEAEVRRMTQEAVCLLDTLPGDTEFLTKMLLGMASRGN